MTGTREISGSEATRFKNVTISLCASSKGASMFTSITIAPASTCLRAIERASSYFFSEMSRKNFFEPATLQRSPTLTKPTSGVTSNSSRPDNHNVDGFLFLICGFFPAANWQ